MLSKNKCLLKLSSRLAWSCVTVKKSNSSLIHFHCVANVLNLWCVCQLSLKINSINFEWLETNVNVLQIHERCQDGRGCTDYCSGSEARTDAGVCLCRPHQQGHWKDHSTRTTYKTPRKQLNCLFLCACLYVIPWMCTVITKDSSLSINIRITPDYEQSCSHQCWSFSLGLLILSLLHIC